MLKLDWGESQVWMVIAAETHNKEHREQDSLGNSVRHRYPKENELNVAYVCAGFAFEIIFKVLVKLSGKAPKPKHEPSIAWKDICEKYCTDVERLIVSHGWTDITVFLQFLDQHLCNKDRKYWMRSPSGGPAAGTFSIGGPRGINALWQLHEELSNYVLAKINADHNVHEIWEVRGDIPNKW